MELFVELKHDTTFNPFRDLENGGMEERYSIDGDHTREQCLLYVANQFAYQHRLFAFSLVICGQVARFVRWDREGAVVSAGIDCSQRQDLVIEFLQWFNHLTDNQRGLDPTVVPATPEEVEMFESAAEKVEIESLKRSIGGPEDIPAIPTRGPQCERQGVILRRWEGPRPQPGCPGTLHPRIYCPRPRRGGWPKLRSRTWSSSSTRPTSSLPHRPSTTMAPLPSALRKRRGETKCNGG